MIIGICGFASSGKGTVADILVEKFGFSKLSFADSLKDAVAAIFSWPRELLEGDTDESRVFRETKDEWWSEKLGYDVTPRKILQLMGTEAGRNVFGSDVWLYALSRKIDPAKNYVIPDTRFPNEIAFIQSLNGFTIQISRGKQPSWYQKALSDNTSGTSLMKDVDVHFSEWAFIGSKFDYSIRNDSSKVLLESDVNHMMKIFTGPIS